MDDNKKLKLVTFNHEPGRTDGINKTFFGDEDELRPISPDPTFVKRKSIKLNKIDKVKLSSGTAPSTVIYQINLQRKKLKKVELKQTDGGSVLVSNMPSVKPPPKINRDELKLSFDRDNHTVPNGWKDNRCRLCTDRNNDNMSLFDDGSESLIKTLAESLNIKVTKEDTLPLFICYSCLKVVQLIDKFKDKAQFYQTILSEYEEGLTRKKTKTTVKRNIPRKTLKRKTYDGIDGLEPKVECISCGEMFYNNTDLRSHVLTAHMQFTENKSKKTYKCKLCNRLYKDVRAFNSHLYHVHTRKPPRKTIYECDICDKKFLKKNGIRAHISTHLDVKELHMHCFVCDHLVKISCFASHMKDHLKKCQIKCTKCDFRTSQRSFHQRHLARHAEDLCMYHCYVCNLEIQSIYFFDKHQRIHRDEHEKYLCTLCLVSFDEFEELDDHCKLEHMKPPNSTGQKVYCSNCNQYFINTQEKLDHMSSCPMTIFRCETCGHQSENIENYIKHRKTHKDSYFYVCYTCNVMYRRVDNFNRHIPTHYTHLRHRCDGCNDRFRTAYDLTAHKVIAHGIVTEFHCKNCKKYMPNAARFRIHTKRCTTPLPITCRYCGLKYFTKQSYSHHLRLMTHHKPMYHCDICYVFSCPDIYAMEEHYNACVKARDAQNLDNN